MDFLQQFADIVSLNLKRRKILLSIQTLFYVQPATFL